jgi:hypothetical protein
MRPIDQHFLEEERRHTLRVARASLVVWTIGFVPVAITLASAARNTGSRGEVQGGMDAMGAVIFFLIFVAASVIGLGLAIYAVRRERTRSTLAAASLNGGSLLVAVGVVISLFI